MSDQRVKVDIWELYGLSQDQIKTLVDEDSLLWFHFSVEEKCDEIHIEISQEQKSNLEKFVKLITRK